MQYLPFLSILAVALAGQSISPVLIRSGSQYQYASLGADGDNVVPNGKTELKLVLNDDGSLVDTSSQKYVNIGSDGYVTLSDKAQKGFSINDDNHLVHDSNSGFGVENNKIAFDKSGSDFLGVAVRIMDSQKVDDVSPKGKTETASTTEAPKSTASAKPTESAPKTEASQAAQSKDGKFGLIAIHSGSNVQNAAIKKVESHPHVFAVGGDQGEDLQLTFGEDKTTLFDQNGRGINLDEKTGELGDVPPFGRQPATTGFSIKDGHLAYNGNTAWNACPSEGSELSLSNKDCPGGTSIELRVV